MNELLIAPSLLAADWGNLAEQIRRTEDAGADWLHLDVMDGHFVDNISFGPAFVETVARSARVPLDVHLMISRPDHYFSRFAKHAATITVHVEAEHDAGATLRAIRASGCGAGIALNPPTPFSAIEPLLELADLVLIMTVNPGFGGQSFMEETMGKVAAAAEARKSNGLKYRIEVDGGIDVHTAPIAVRHGAGVLVAGTSVFGQQDFGSAIHGMRQACSLFASGQGKA